MTAEPHNPGDFTQEPHESDLVLHRAPLYAEEPGIKPGKPSTVTLAPCTTCGVPVITGITDHGKLIPVEPQTITYALLWAQWRAPSPAQARAWLSGTSVPHLKGERRCTTRTWTRTWTSPQSWRVNHRWPARWV